MFAFYRLIFAVLLFLIAYKKGYGKLFWAGMGFILGPIALVGILLYRKNANYTRALLNGVSGILAGGFVVIAAWYIVGSYVSMEALEQAIGGVDVFWYRVVPMASASIGFIVFCATMAYTAANEPPDTP